MRSMHRSVTRRRFLAVSGLAAAGGAALLAGCGSDEQGGETPTETASPTEAPETPAATETAAETPSPTEEETPAPTETEAPAVGWMPVTLGQGGPSARRDHLLVVSRAGHVFVHGGRAGGAALGDLHVYDPETEAWTEVSSGGPAPRFGHSGVWDQQRNRVVIFGGQAGSDFFDDTWEYSLESGQWQQLAAGQAAPAARYGAGHALDPDMGWFFITHGFTFQGRFDDTWVFNLEADFWEEVSPVQGERPVKRCLLRTVWDSRAQKLYLFGGQSDDNPFLGDLWEYEPKGRFWTQLAAEGPEPRSFYTLVYHRPSGATVLATGNSAGGPLGDTWAFQGGGWEQLPFQVEARESADAALLPDGSVLLWGGSTSAGEVNEAFVLTLEA